jgi:hypothetical protein
MRESVASAGSAPQRQRGKTFALLEPMVGEGVVLDRACYCRNSLHKYAWYAVEDENTADSPAFPGSHDSWVRYPAPDERCASTDNAPERWQSGHPSSDR